MPCCHSVLSAAASAASSRSTPSWLHRLHAKGGLSFPSHLHIDDLLYGQPLPPPPLPPPSSSSNQQHAVALERPPKAKHPKPKQQHPPNYPSRPNPSSPQPPISAVISDVFAISSDLPPPTPLKAFRKQSRPRPRPDNSPSLHKDKKNKAKKDKKARAKARKRSRAERAADADGERSTKTEITVMDTSTDGWKAVKLLVRKGAVWKVRDKKASEISEPEDLNKSKRRAGLVSKTKMQKDREKEKETTLQGNIHASSGDVMSGDVMKESDDPIQTLKRPRCSETVPEGQSAGILRLQTTNRGKKNGLASPKGDLKGK